jgi:hypothetical protein
MNTTIAQNPALINHLMVLLDRHRPLCGQARVYHRVIGLVLSELFVFGRHTVTQQLQSLGLNEEDWSAWYRVFSEGRFEAERCSEVLVAESLQHVGANELYVVAGDGTQTPRTGSKIEGVGWLKNPRTPAFKVGIHRAQRWFHGSWLLPAEEGYSRALPLRWLPAFTAKAHCRVEPPCKEWEAAVQFLTWLQGQFARHARPQQPLLMVGDGSYDTVPLWTHLPPGALLLARSARNRVLFHLPPADCHGNRKYGPRALSPQQFWQSHTGWHKLNLPVRGTIRHLQYRVEGPFLREGAPQVPLFLIIVRGKHHVRQGRRVQRDPLPFLVNAVQNAQGQWVLPLPVATLLFWAWQRWEVEVTHRELKATFGLGHKQCWNPHAAVASVQWSAWVYALLLLAGYRTWGLTHGPAVPTRWWSGAGRWSFNTLWRSFRAAFWGTFHFQPVWSPTAHDWLEIPACEHALGNAAFSFVRT